MKRRMTLKALAMIGFTGLIGTNLLAAGQDTPPCCQKKDQPADKAKAKPSTKMRCTLTGKIVDKCCCEQREGKTYCPLADKTVEKCCCEPVAEEPAKK